MTLLGFFGLFVYAVIAIVLFGVSLKDYITLSDDVSREVQPGYQYIKHTVKVNRKQALEDLNNSKRYMKLSPVWPVALVQSGYEAATKASKVHEKLNQDLTREELKDLLDYYDRTHK